MINNRFTKRSIHSLKPNELLALAIASEEDDARIYRAYVQNIRENYPEHAEQFQLMADEEDTHRQKLLTLYEAKFGKEIPLIRREYIRNMPVPKMTWLSVDLSLDAAKEAVKSMEEASERFYLYAMKHTEDVEMRALFGDLAAAESHHGQIAHEGFQKTEGIENELSDEHRDFILTYIQPGLAGLIDGSVSTLAPIFAAAFATGSSHETLLIGLSASVGAGISMGFTEAISDDGIISGRGSPIIRGIVTGIMTTLGGLGHALPYLINDVILATSVAAFIVFVELFVITYVQNHYMKTPWLKASLQVIIGGGLVLAAGILIGSG